MGKWNSRLSYILSERYLFLMVCLSFFCLGCAFFVEYGLGFKPCLFCWIERGVYALLAACSVILSYVRCKKACAPKILLGVLVVGVVANSMHIGIEHGWISESLCKVEGVNYEEILESLKDLDDNDERMPSCAKVPFYILGLSMAEYNWMLFFVLAVWMFVIMRHESRVARGKRK